MHVALGLVAIVPGICHDWLVLVQQRVGLRPLLVWQISITTSSWRQKLVSSFICFFERVVTEN